MVFINTRAKTHGSRGWLWLWCGALLLLPGTMAEAGAPVIAPEVGRTIAERGRTRVIVRLKDEAAGGQSRDNQGSPSGTRPPKGGTTYFGNGSKAVAHAQNLLLSKLTVAAGAGWRPGRKLLTVPLVAGEVDVAGLAALEQMPEVAAVTVDRPVEGALAESTRVIGATAVNGFAGSPGAGWDGTGVTVGLIDTGIDVAHPDLADALTTGTRILGGAEATDLTTAQAVQDDNGHGTFVAGIITSDGRVAPRGVAPGCRLVVVKALDQNNQGLESDVLAGIDWILAHHAGYPGLKFINLSIVLAGDPPAHCPCDDLPEQAIWAPVIARALAADVRLIAPAGNDGAGTLRAPACFSGMVSVGATFDAAFDRAPETGSYSDAAPLFPLAYDDHPSTHDLTAFSNRNDNMSFVAPGYLITSSWTGGTARSSFGTSAAVAHVTATLALMQCHAPRQTGAYLLDLLAQTAAATADPFNRFITYRRIDAKAAVLAAHNSAVRDWAIYR